VAVGLVTALFGLALVADAALGHAQLLASEPKQGESLKRPPRAFILTFSEGIETDFVQLAVEDAGGGRVNRGEPYHPPGHEEVVAVRLGPGLEGKYVASYRVISEDGHPVSESTTFAVEPPMSARRGDEDKEPVPSGAAGGAMPPSQGEHVGSLTGPITDTAFAAARGAGYVAIALAVGGAVFLAVVWLPALMQHAGTSREWRAASEGFVGCVRRVALGAVLLGLVATALAIVLEAATVAGVSFWAALDPDVLEPVSDTRVVQAWSARFVVWLVLGGLLLSALGPRRAPVLRRAALGADGAIVGPIPPRPHRLLLLAAVVALAVTVPVAGHAWTYSPEGLLFFSDTAHVLCMSIWVGGLVLLLLAVPIATRPLSPRERTPYLAEVVGRFSRVALVAVSFLVLTGVIQSVALVGSVPALIDTAYGRLVLAKIALLIALVSLGAYNRRRSLPRLKRLAAGEEEPGRAATMLHGAVAAEVAFALIVLGVTSVLVATQPASG
jgi:copper transport protein